MSYEYAGSLFDTEHAAQLAALHDWLTAGGSNSVSFVASELWHELTRHEYVNDLVDDIESGDWRMPGLDAPTNDDERWELVDTLRDLAEDWVGEHRGEVLAQVRADLGMNQTDFADMLKIAGGQQTISKYERGETTPSRQTVMLAKMMAENPELWQ